MSETSDAIIKDNVKRKLRSIVAMARRDEHLARHCAKNILSITELAIVDRRAEFPEELIGYSQLKDALRKAGWVKEVK